jgi:hypothetical protein
VNLMSLTPTRIFTSPGPRFGACAACGKSLSPSDEAICLYGERFHRECAFYTPRSERQSNGR